MSAGLVATGVDMSFPGEHPDAVAFKEWKENAVSFAASQPGWSAVIAGRRPAAVAPDKDLTQVPTLVLGVGGNNVVRINSQ